MKPFVIAAAAVLLSGCGSKDEAEDAHKPKLLCIQTMKKSIKVYGGRGTEPREEIVDECIKKALVCPEPLKLYSHRPRGNVTEILYCQLKALGDEA